MNGPIARKGQIYTFIRYAPATLNKQTGQATPQSEVLNNGQPWQMLASIQPIMGFKALMLPEGFRDRAACTVYTETLLQLADEARKTWGDRFNWNGYWYEVTFRQDWTGVLLNHFAYQCFKVDNR